MGDFRGTLACEVVRSLPPPRDNDSVKVSSITTVKQIAHLLKLRANGSEMASAVGVSCLLTGGSLVALVDGKTVPPESWA